MQRATKLGEAEVVDLFLAKFEDVAKEDSSLLRLAVLSDNEQIVNTLLRKGADVVATDQDGNTPLHEACRSGRRQIAQLLIDKNSESVNKENSSQRTSMHYAAEGGYTEIIALLCKEGAAVDAVDEDGDTPLHRAALYPQLFEKVQNCLMKYGSRIDIKNKGGHTALDIYGTLINLNQNSYVRIPN